MSELDKMIEIVGRHAAAMAEELEAEVSGDLGFMITACLPGDEPGRVHVQHAGTLDRKAACEIFAQYLHDHDEEVQKLKTGGALIN